MLFTFAVSSGSKSYTTQLQAESWDAARDVLLASPGFREFVEAVMPGVGSSPLTKKDVFLFAPMDPLINCRVIQGGRQGEYFTAIVVGTAESEWAD